MDIILLERVPHLGNLGEIVSVKTGYARNFLLPQRKAMRANAANKALFETRRVQLEADNAQRRQVAQIAGEKIDGCKIILIRQAGDTGQLYGSVSNRDIADALRDMGHEVARNQVTMERPLKNLGISLVPVQLHADVLVMVSVNIARSEAEAALQAKGINVTLDQDEDDDIVDTDDADEEADSAELEEEALA